MRDHESQFAAVRIADESGTAKDYGESLTGNDAAAGIPGREGEISLSVSPYHGKAGEWRSEY